MSPCSLQVSSDGALISLSTDARLAASHILLQFLVFEMCFQFLVFEMCFQFPVVSGVSVSGVSGVSEALTCGIAPSQFSAKMIAKQERQCQLNVLFS